MCKKFIATLIVSFFLFFTMIVPGSAQVIIEEVGTSIFPSNFMPAQGSVGALVIPVEFIDFRFQEDPVENLDALFRGEGTAYAPSVEEYFEKASYGTMQIDAQVQPVVRLQDTRRSYADAHIQLIEDVLTAVKEQGTDLYDFDQNADGILDSLYIVWAGAAEDSGGDWWPYSDTFYFEYEAAGIQLGSFSSLSYELLMQDSALRQYTAIHETGHQLGLTDYYVDSYTGGTGAAVMMDRNEGDEDCFSKLLLGWNTPQVVLASSYITLESASITSDVVLIAPDSWDGNYLSEYFMAEYVTPEANQSSQPLAAGGGVRIWHVNAATSMWTDDITASMYRSDNSGDGPKLLCIVDPDTEWYGTGDVIHEEQTVLYTGEESGIQIRIEKIEEGRAQLCIVYFGEEPAKPEKDDEIVENVLDSESVNETSEGTMIQEEAVTEESLHEDFGNASRQDSASHASGVIPILILIGIGVLIYFLLRNGRKRKYKKRRRRRK